MIIETITKTIHEDYHLQRAGRNWLVSTYGPQNIKLRAPNCHAIGFSLDHRDEPPLAFFSGSPPKDLAKMCDAIIVLLYEYTLYVLVIEVKTVHKDEANKQLANGKHFCHWLMALYKEHGYLKHLKTDPVYIGVLIWQPRLKSIKKGTTNIKEKTALKRSKMTTSIRHFTSKIFRKLTCKHSWVKAWVQNRSAGYGLPIEVTMSLNKPIPTTDPSSK